MTWRPLLQGDRAARAGELLARVAEQLAAPCEPPGMYHGSAGRALFYAYLGQGAEHLEAQLDRALEGAGAIEEGTLVDGMAGLAWVMAHLGQDVDPQVDDALGSLVAPEQPFELLYGMAGIGVYALERMPDTRALLERVIAALESAAGATDLGVSHGLGGAVAVAGAAAGWSVAGARQRYEQLRDDLWRHALDTPHGCFPAKAGEPGLSRAAWCYGDPGLAAALHEAAVAAGDEEGARRAHDLARRTARRRDPQTSGADEPTLCHGWIGLAHLYNRLAQALGDDQLAQAALEWYDRALAAPLPETSDFLTGTLGTGLALLAATSDVEPRWDRLLCVTVRSPARS